MKVHFRLFFSSVTMDNPAHAIYDPVCTPWLPCKNYNTCLRVRKHSQKGQDKILMQNSRAMKSRNRCIMFSAAVILPAVMQKMTEITLIMIHLTIRQLKVSRTGLDM